MLKTYTYKLSRNPKIIKIMIYLMIAISIRICSAVVGRPDYSSPGSPMIKTTPPGACSSPPSLSSRPAAAKGWPSWTWETLGKRIWASDGTTFSAAKQWPSYLSPGSPAPQSLPPAIAAVPSPASWPAAAKGRPSRSWGYLSALSRPLPG